MGEKSEVFDFDPARYQARMKEAARRIDTARSFHEADRVPVVMPVGGSYFARMFGYNIRDYFTDIETNIAAKVKGLKWAFEELQDDRTGASLALDLGPVYEGLLFDCRIEFPDDTSPRIVHRLETRDDVVKFQLPEIEGHPKVEWAFDRWEKFRALARKMAPKMPISEGGFGIHPPLSCACAIMSPAKVYEMFYTEPELLGQFLDKLLEAFIRLRDYCDRRLGRRTTTLGLADDNSAFISPEMYREHVAPRLKTLYDRYGREGRWLHADGPNDHLFDVIADYLKVDSMDIGGFSSIDAAVRAMKGKTVIEGNMNNRDLYGPLDEKAKAKVRHMIRTGGPRGGYIFAIGGEAYVGVPPQTMIDLVAYARQAGRYPINVED